MAALRYLEMQRAVQPELAEWYSSMADLYQRKLWHQLTQKLEQFFALTVFQVSLFSSFLVSFLHICCLFSVNSAAFLFILFVGSGRVFSFRV
jgi:hypothetical protein